MRGRRCLSRSSCAAMAAISHPTFDFFFLRWRGSRRRKVVIPAVKAGPPRFDNDIKVNRPRPGRSNRALVLGQMVDSVQDESPCLIANRIKAG